MLLDIFTQSASDDLLRWKLVRAFQSYPSGLVRELLEEIIRAGDNPIMRCEAVRSLSLHKAGVGNEIRHVIERDTHPEVRKVANFFLK